MANESMITGRVEAALAAPDPETFLSIRQKMIEVEFAGIKGDRHSGLTHASDGRTPHYPQGTEIRNDRQVTIISVEEMAAVAKVLGVNEIRPEWLGANLLLSGIPRLTQLPPNTRLTFEGGAVLIVMKENGPCGFTGKVIADEHKRPELKDAFVKHALHLRGVSAVVEKPGMIEEGTSVTAAIPEQTLYNPGGA